VASSNPPILKARQGQRSRNKNNRAQEWLLPRPKQMWIEYVCPQNALLYPSCSCLPACSLSCCSVHIKPRRLTTRLNETQRWHVACRNPGHWQKELLYALHYAVLKKLTEGCKEKSNRFTSLYLLESTEMTRPHAWRSGCALFVELMAQPQEPGIPQRRISQEVFCWRTNRQSWSMEPE
jgi:hypothetical protein